MVEVFDIVLQDDFDLAVNNGDFETGESTLRHHQCLLLAEPGNLKMTPAMGVGVRSFMNDDTEAEELKKAIQMNFEADGMTIQKLEVTGRDNINIEATY